MTDEQFNLWMADQTAQRCLLVEVGVNTAGAEAVRYLSNVGYVSTPADTPPNTVYDPVVVGGLTVQQKLDESGSPSIAWGDIEVQNMDGVRDHWLYDVWSGRSVAVKLGDAGWPVSDFRTVFEGVVEDIAARSADTLNLLIRDKAQRLNTPLVDTLLGGDGPNKDDPPPLCFGEVHNVAPVLYDAATLEYRVHNGPIESVIEVRDNGVPVEFTPLLSSGGFTLAHSPVGDVTASAQGAKHSGTYMNTVARLVAFIAVNYGSQPLQPQEVSQAALDAFDGLHTQPVGVYVRDRGNTLATCQTLAASVGAQVAFDNESRLTLLKVDDPTGKPAVATITPSDTLMGSVRPTQTPKVRSSVRVAFCKNWQVQQGLTTGLPPDHASLFAQEWLTAQATNTTAAAQWRQSTAPEPEETMLLRSEDAQAEASRRLALWGSRRQMYEATVWGSALTLPLGAFCSISDTRFGLINGKPGQVVGRRVDWLAGTVTLEVLT